MSFGDGPTINIFGMVEHRGNILDSLDLADRKRAAQNARVTWETYTEDDKTHYKADDACLARLRERFQGNQARVREIMSLDEFD